jgi:hypothetical protein
VIGTAPASFALGREQVEDMMRRGTAFSAVEEAIDAAPISQLHKAALWLFAWSLRDPVLQRREARQILEASIAGVCG